MTTDRFDIYQHVTDKIVAALETQKAGEWRMPWHSVVAKDSGAGVFALPRNTGGRNYRGINIWLLIAEKISKGYASDTWGTYKAFQAAGANVRKGEKATMIVFWKPLEIDERNETTGEIKRKKILMARGYNVFNADQVDNYTAKASKKPELSVEQRIEAAEAFFAAVPADVVHGGNRACYIPAIDQINLPTFEQFRAAEDYYSTRGHETVHWTGHSTRCARDLQNRFGSEAYAFEELVAEIGAAYLCGHLGISNDPRPDHAQYLASWLRRMKEDKKAIFTAASQAQKAVDYIIGEAAGEEEEIGLERIAA